MRRYKNKLKTTLAPAQRNKLVTKIEELKMEQKQSFITERFENEDRAVNKIKTDSKYFFKYANRFRKVLSSPSILVDENENLITDPKSIADRLQDHFKSVFSTPNINLKPTVSTPNIVFPLSDFYITDLDVTRAINEMKANSSCPKDNIPAKFLKECKSTLSYPLRLFYQKSFDSGIVPEAYKLQQIIPIHI